MIHLPNLISDLALILASAGAVTLIFKKLKQPLVLGYIIAGFMVGPNFSLFPSISDIESIKIWAEIGVIFLLFSLGLEFSFKKLMKVGGSSSITAIIEIVTMIIIGYFTGQLLGWTTMNSIFLGGILSISSTTIIIRAFDELGLKTQKVASLVFGVLIVEDLVAILLLVLLSTLALSQQFAGTEVIVSLLKLGFFLSLWFLGGIFLIPTFLKSARKLMSDETMLIISLGLCLVMVVLAVKAGFSAALGAFIMGSILAETTYAERIEHLVKPVKNLFGAVFFVSVGMLIEPSMLREYALPILIITLVTILGKSISTAVGSLISGQTLRHSIKAGLSLSQIGEFSFIIATLGLTLNVTSDFLYPVAVAVSAVTTFTTPYLIRSSDSIYKGLEKILPSVWVHNMNRYSSGSQIIKVESEWKILLRAYAVTLIINSVILIAMVLISSRILFPFMTSNVGNSTLGASFTAAISLLLMSPFLWGLAGKKFESDEYYNLWMEQKYNRGPLMMLEFFRITVAVFFVGSLFYQLFSGGIFVIIAMTIMIIIVIIFSTKLRDFYFRIEERFLENLNAREAEKPLHPAIEMLPWDVHIAEFIISPECSLVGITLIDLRLREKYGINIGTIERGKIKINIPSKNEKLYPGDNISVIGTDESLENFKELLNTSEIEVNEISNSHDEITLQQFIIGSKSPLLGKSIRKAGIHEKLFALVIGLERRGERISNPESTIRFERGDVVWIVGESNIFRKLLKSME